MSDQQIGRITFGPPLSAGDRVELMRRARFTWGESVRTAVRMDAEVERLCARVAELEAGMRDRAKRIYSLERVEEAVREHHGPPTGNDCNVCNALRALDEEWRG